MYCHGLPCVLSQRNVTEMFTLLCNMFELRVAQVEGNSLL